MKTSVERVDDTTVKLSITVESDRVDQAFAEAAKHMAADVKIPGFRPGRVPKKVLERRLGPGALAQHAVRDALPTFYTEAVQAEELDVVGPPEFDVDTFEEGQAGVFSAAVAVRPEFEIPNYAGRQIVHPEWEVTDDEMSDQLDALRDRFAELETVKRPVQVGDHVRTTITGAKDGEPDADASGEDILYEVGDPNVTDVELDRQLLGKEAGAIVKFTDTLGADYGDRAGDELDFTVIVKEVKAKKLPELDDDFAVTASEFDTIKELQTAVRTGLARQKRATARQNLRSSVVQEIAAEIDVPLPEVMIADELRFRVSRIAAQAEQYEMEFADYLAAMGMDIEELQSTLREQSEETVTAQLVIDAVGRQAGIEISNDDLGMEVARQAARIGRPVEEVAEMMNSREHIQALVNDAVRRKTIDHMLSLVEITNAPPEDDTDLDPVIPDEPAPDEDDDVTPEIATEIAPESVASQPVSQDEGAIVSETAGSEETDSDLEQS